MFNYSTLALLTIPVFLLQIGCVRKKDRTPTTKQSVWDLSQDENVSRVGWPPGLVADEWSIEGPETVELVLRGGERGAVTFQNAQIRAYGSKVVVVRLLFPPETLEEAYRRATALAAQWRITDTGDLDKWYKTDGHSIDYPHTGYVSISQHDLPQPRGIEVRESFAGDRAPWYVVFGFGFPANDMPGPGRPVLDKMGPPSP